MENILVGILIYSKMRQMLSEIIGTAAFVIIIVVTWLNIIGAHEILASYWSLVKVTISLTFSIVVVFDWTYDLSILIEHLWGHFSSIVVKAT